MKYEQVIIHEVICAKENRGAAQIRGPLWCSGQAVTAGFLVFVQAAMPFSVHVSLVNSCPSLYRTFVDHVFVSQPSLYRMVCFRVDGTGLWLRDMRASLLPGCQFMVRC